LNLRRKPKDKLWLNLKPLKVKYQPKPANFILDVLKQYYPDATIIQLDVSYHIEPKAVVEEWIREFPRIRPYIKEVYDCDNFAFWFKAWMSLRFLLNSVGYCHGMHPLGYHAFNLVVTLEKQPYTIEPQAPYRLLPYNVYGVDWIII